MRELNNGTPANPGGHIGECSWKPLGSSRPIFENSVHKLKVGCIYIATTNNWPKIESNQLN